MDVSQHAFHAAPGSTVNIATPGTTSSNVQIETLLTSRHVRVVNATSGPVFIEFGGSSVTASSSTGMPILQNEVDIFALAGPYVAVVALAALTGSVYFTPGEGMD